MITTNNHRYQQIYPDNKQSSMQNIHIPNLPIIPQNLDDCKILDFSQIHLQKLEKENKSNRNINGNNAGGVITPNRLQQSSQQNNFGFTPNAKNEYASLSGMPRAGHNPYQLLTPQNFTTAAMIKTSIDQLSSVRAVRFDAENNNQDDKKFHSSISPHQNNKIQSQNNIRASHNDIKNIGYENSGSPTNKDSMSDISIKILNEILNSPMSARSNNKQNRVQQQLQSSAQGLNKKKSPCKSKSPLNSSRGGPLFVGQLNSSYTNSDLQSLKYQRSSDVNYQNKNSECYKQVKNSQELQKNNNNNYIIPPIDELKQIKDKIKEKKELIETKKSELEFIMAKISNQINACKINSIIENALVAKCGENKKKIDSIQIQQLQEKKEIAKIEESSSKHKFKISNLQQKLEIIKQQEQRYQSLKEKKIKDVKEEFQKKNLQMSQMFNEVSQQYQEFIENLEQIEENHNIDLETKALLKEDLNGKLIQRAEIVAQKEDLEQIFEQFISQYPEEYEYINEAQKMDNIIEEIQRSLEGQINEQSRLQHQKGILMNKLKDKESYFNHYSSKLEDLGELIKKEKSHSTQSLEQSENILQNLSANYDLPDLEIMCCNFIILISGSFYNQNGPAIQQIVQGLRFSQTGITIFRLMEYFQQTYLGEVNKDSEYFINSLSSLFDSLVQLEDINEKYFKQEQEIVHQISKYSLELESVKKELTTVSSRIEYLQQQITNDQEMLKKSEQSKMVLNENLKIPVKKSAQIVFQQYCDKQKEQFQSIASEHGEEQVENLMRDHSDQFVYLMTLQQQERMQRMKEVKEERIQLEKSVQDNINIVESEILPKLKSLVVELSNSKMQLDMMHDDLENYKESKSKVEEDMKLLEKCLNQKIHEIEQNLKSQFQDVIGKSEAIELELNNETNELKEETISIEKIKQRIDSNRQLEQTLKDEISKLQQKKKLIDDLKSQTTTVQQETCRRELEIAELEKQIAKLEVRKLVLENPTELPQNQQQQSQNTQNDFNNSYYIQNQKSHSKSYITNNDQQIYNNQQQQQQSQPKNIYINYSSQGMQQPVRQSAQPAFNHKGSADYSQSSSFQFHPNIPSNSSICSNLQYTPNNNPMRQSDLISQSLQNIQQYSPMNSQREIGQNNNNNINQKTANTTATSSTNNITSQSLSSNSQSINSYNHNSQKNQQSYSSQNNQQQGIQISHFQNPTQHSYNQQQQQQQLSMNQIQKQQSNQNMNKHQQSPSSNNNNNNNNGCYETPLQNKGLATRISHIANGSNYNLNTQRNSQSKSPFASPREKIIYYPNTCRTSYVQSSNNNTTAFNSQQQQQQQVNLRNSYTKNYQNSPKSKSNWK